MTTTQTTTAQEWLYEVKEQFEACIEMLDYSAEIDDDDMTDRFRVGFDGAITQDDIDKLDNEVEQWLDADEDNEGSTRARFIEDNDLAETTTLAYWIEVIDDETLEVTVEITA